MAMDVRVLEDPAAPCAEMLAEAARAGGHIALTGGSTPGRAYEHAAALEENWSRAELWWGDDRCVPPDDELSNYRLAKDALLDQLPEEGAPVVPPLKLSAARSSPSPSGRGCSPAPSSSIS